MQKEKETPFKLGREALLTPMQNELHLSNTVLNTQMCDRTVPAHSFQFAYKKHR